MGPVIAGGTVDGRGGVRGRGGFVGRVRRIGRALRTTFGSMMGQMVLATALFVGCGIYLFAVAPILSIPPLGQIDPMRHTVSKVAEAAQAALFVPAERGGLRSVLRNPLVRDVVRHNPGFRIYLRSGEATFGTGAPDRWFALGLDRLEAVRRTLPDQSMCTQLERVQPDGRRGDYVYYSNCGTVRYVQFSGITTPVAIPTPTRFQAYRAWLWSYSRGFLLPSLGVFAILVTILLVNVLRIRRVARLTHALSGDKPGRLLPEAGLPSEVTPLVRAMNVLIARADDAQRRRRFFLSAAAHEMRTPLNVLRTRLESLPEDQLRAKLIGDLSRLTTLSNDLLTLMSIDGRTRPFAPVELDECCLAVIGDMDELAASKDVTFRFVQPHAPTRINADAALVTVAITNLIDNALSFAPAGSSVTVALDGEGGLEVRDMGSGIPLLDADTLFEPFVRASGKRPGHGLGLAIVRAVADLHGASVTAANAAGGGARFTMRFPVVMPA